ncbi:MAG: sugar phosphate nucleotidyltransferase [Solirubrobacteraceae bacterium]
MQALILAGGEGTRLRPLTCTFPKPVVPLAGRPFMLYMIEWLRGHGVREVILSCGFMARGVRSVLGDGSALGVHLSYVEEPRPLGTGGALKFARDRLDERFLMLNGDVLSDIDLSAQLAQHERSGARATLALVAVKDPSAYGLVTLRADGSVQEFAEKPGPRRVDPPASERSATNLINAGAYILQREVLDEMAPAGCSSSIERELFPALVGRGLYGYASSAYWLDIGTPARYLQGTFDILQGNVSTETGRRLRDAGMVLADGARIDGRLLPPALVGSGSVLAPGAHAGGLVVLGREVRIEPGARVERSVLLDGCSVGTHSTVSGSIVGPGVRIGEHCQIGGGVVLGEGVKIGSGNTLAAGARIFPGVELPEEAIKF